MNTKDLTRLLDYLYKIILYPIPYNEIKVMVDREANFGNPYIFVT